MSIYLRNGYWYIHIVPKYGREIRRSAKTKDKQKAQQLHDKLKHELWRAKELGEKPKHFWDEACVRFIEEKSHKRSLNDDMQKIAALTEFRGMLLNDMSRDFISSVVSKLACGSTTKTDT